jgi:flagellar hook assembly protein FlgD
LGAIRVGTNITEYKWDGTDMFGQKLANGVYLYRVVTSLDGKKMEQFRVNDGFNQNTQDVTDQYFKKGYGKMVILR